MSFKKDDSFCVPLWIAGETICPEGSPKYEVTTPPRQTLAWQACAATPPSINQAIEAASLAFPLWSKTPLENRISIFSEAANLLESKADEVQYLFKQEIGAGDKWSSFNQNFCVEALRSINNILEDALGAEVVYGADRMKGIVKRAPYGVVGAIAPWNAPLILGLRSVLAPIAAGNTVVMLAAPLSPMTHHFIGLLLHSAGLPAGVLNILPAPPSPEDAAEAVETLLKHPSVRYLNFTGSTAVGRKINEVAGKYGKPVTMELGGKCVALALEDANVEKLAQELVIGAYLNSGQICMSTELAIIPRYMIPQLIEKIVEFIPMFLPEAAVPLITTASKERNVKMLIEAWEMGATIYNSFGEKLARHQIEEVSGNPDPRFPHDSTFPLRFLTNITKKMAIYNTETFAPIFCILDYNDENVKEAVKMINDLEFGLSVSIFSADEKEAMRIADDIESGAVHINHMTVYDNPLFPHGGVKGSGYGRFGGKWGIQEFTYVKTITKM